MTAGVETAVVFEVIGLSAPCPPTDDEHAVTAATATLTTAPARTRFRTDMTGSSASAALPNGCALTG